MKTKKMWQILKYRITTHCIIVSDSDFTSSEDSCIWLMILLNLFLIWSANELRRELIAAHCDSEGLLFADTPWLSQIISIKDSLKTKMNDCTNFILR